MLFRIIQLTKQGKEGSEDPMGFVSRQAKGAIIEALLIPILGLVAFLVFLFLLSYTHFLGGPYGIARFFFWLLVLVYGTAGYFFYTIYSSFKKVISESKKKMKQKESFTADGKRIREAEVVEEE